ncbi:MAG: TIGR02300 family protein [Pseudomonadota bacterium]
MKPEWGTKRICQSCGAKFYDFQRTPIVCPACGATFELEVLTRARRGRGVARAAAVATPEAVVEDEDELEKLEVDDEADADFESADELGEDGDVGDVIAPATDDDDESR